jgi:hypothetical protein
MSDKFLGFPGAFLRGSSLANKNFIIVTLSCPFCQLIYSTSDCWSRAEHVKQLQQVIVFVLPAFINYNIILTFGLNQSSVSNSALGDQTVSSVNISRCHLGEK